MAESAEQYLREQGTDEWIDLDAATESVDHSETVSGERDEPFPPDLEDLARLHRLVREREAFTVLEFGVGWSTGVIADALKKNQRRWESLRDPPPVRNRYQFEVFAVDASEHWLSYWRDNLPEDLVDVAAFHHSPVEVGTFDGRICHYYTELPDVVPDFIYLDGPHPNHVEGELYGMSFECDERTVMSADLLAMESILLPGTFVLVDGRTNNARFLERQFNRDWNVDEDRVEDITTFVLDEDSLGPYNWRPDRTVEDFL